MFTRPFKFLDLGPFIDSELELVTPQDRWAEEAAIGASSDEPSVGKVTRAQIQHFLSSCPRGYQRAEPSKGVVPTYHYWMRCNDPDFVATIPIGSIVGTIALRIGNTPDIVKYFGHVGYNVYPAARGHHYAERATRLLLPLARAHGLTELWITCNPDNLPSRRTCERLHGEWVDTIPVPKNHPLYLRGDFEKCRYRIDLSRSL